MEKVIYIAGGCFWGVEKYYQLLNGVVSTRVGYANGDKVNPNYEEVKAHLTTHAETLKLTYDDEVITLEMILDHFLRFVNPYSVDRQGDDEGHQYRSGVYYVDDEDERVILDYFNKNLDVGYKIEAKKLENFYDAEEYHQDYLTKNPGGYCHVNLGLISKNEKKVDKKKQWLDILAYDFLPYTPSCVRPSIFCHFFRFFSVFFPKSPSGSVLMPYHVRNFWSFVTSAPFEPFFKVGRAIAPVYLVVGFLTGFGGSFACAKHH